MALTQWMVIRNLQHYTIVTSQYYLLLLLIVMVW